MKSIYLRKYFGSNFFQGKICLGSGFSLNLSGFLHFFLFILQAFSDHSDSVSRRMGFIPLPLGVVMIRVIGTAVRAHTYGSIIIFMLAYFCLVTFRYVVQCQKPWNNNLFFYISVFFRPLFSSFSNRLGETKFIILHFSVTNLYFSVTNLSFSCRFQRLIEILSSI